MVRVIKPGQLPEEIVYSITCGNCTCEFEFTQKEAKYHEAYDQREGPYLSINCPTCNRDCTTVPISPAEYRRRNNRSTTNYMDR